ncbi:murein hydrolase activator EnvC family protein [Nonomuraea sp. NPDC047897]|uniref:murein hydrolase activator EnvC family protein n=1 Tax=Nonomuraea sp. NPDC047897 TaxID=3364346 RepID=UPI00371BA187
MPNPHSTTHRHDRTLGYGPTSLCDRTQLHEAPPGPADACTVHARRRVLARPLRASPSPHLRPATTARRRSRSAPTPAVAVSSAVVLLVTAASLACADPAAAERSSWRWPLNGRPRVLHRFAPPPERWLSGHRGVDLAAPPGTPVLAVGSGVVRYAGALAGRGVVSIEHPGGLRTTYLPVTAAVRQGQQVGRGDRLGVVAPSPSHCPQSCLHWGLVREPLYLDPLLLLGRSRVRLLPFWPGHRPSHEAPPVTNRKSPPVMESGWGPAPAPPALPLSPSPTVPAEARPAPLTSVDPALIAVSPLALGRIPPAASKSATHAPPRRMTSRSALAFAPRPTPPLPSACHTAAQPATLTPGERHPPDKPRTSRPSHADSTCDVSAPTSHKSHRTRFALTSARLAPPAWRPRPARSHVSNSVIGRSRPSPRTAGMHPSERTTRPPHVSDRSPPYLAPRWSNVSTISAAGIAVIFCALLLVALHGRRHRPQRVDVPRGRHRKGRHRRPSRRFPALPDRRERTYR